MAVSGHSGELYDVGTPRYNAIAKHLLQRLADHRFSHWPEKLAEAIAPLAVNQPALGLPATSPLISQAQQPPAALIAAGHPISEVFAEWRQASKAREKSKDEFGAAIRQFIDLFGDIAVELVTRSIVKQFRKALLQRPTRPSPEIRALPLREQIAIATAQSLPTVSPKSAKKALQGLKSVLAYAVEEDYIEADPSAKVSIDADVGFDDERLPFDETQLRRIYSQPTLIDPDVDDDVIFWFFVLAPLTGARGEELAQLRPGNIRAENGVWFIAIERDLKARRQEISETGGTQKKVKTKTSLRKIPVHPLLIAAGFLDLVEHQKSRDAEWLFDDLSSNNRYDARYTALSQKLNRRLRSFGVDNAEFVFHSFRHTLKRALRDDAEIKEEISDLLTGHSFSASVGRKYGSGAGLSTLNAAIKRVEYPEIEWGPVTENGRKRVARLKMAGSRIPDK